MATVEQVASSIPVSSQQGGPLDKQVTDRHILDVCAFMPMWETVASYLGVDEAELESIKEDHSASKKRKEMMLKAWKNAQVFGATYRKLGAVFIDLRRVDCATKVFEFAKAAAPQAMSATSAPISKVGGDSESGSGDLTPYVADVFFTDKEEKIWDEYAKRVIKEYKVESSPLDQKLHFSYVRSALIEVADKWKHIGSVLGLTAAELGAIETQNRRKVDPCLNDMIAKWFQKSSSTNPATLRQLVGAIATQAGGKNPAHAESVSKRFQGGHDVPLAKKVDSTELTGDQVSIDVIAALGDVETKWKEIGIFLGLEIKKLNALDDMPEMVEMWLSKRYDINHFGNPSWQKLVSAVGSKAGAGDVAAAEDIASKHIDPNFKEAPADAATPAPGSTESAEKVVKITDEDDHCLMQDGKKVVKIYKMKKNPHGVALIIINTMFDSGDNYQPVVCNSELLIERLSALDYTPVLLFNLTRDEMKDVLYLASNNSVMIRSRAKEQFSMFEHARNVASADSDSLIVLAISRATGKRVFGTDMKVLTVEDMLNCITTKALVGKPKMVFIQASKKEIHVKKDGTGESEEEDEEEEPGGLDCVPASQSAVRTDATIPRESDRLVYSCPHQDSSPTPRPGMEVVFEILNAKMHDKQHLLEMLTSATKNVRGSWKSNNTLRHNVFFTQ